MFSQAGRAAAGSLGRVVSTAGAKNLATAAQKFGQNAKTVGQNVAKNMAHDMSGTELIKHASTLSSSKLTMVGGLAAIGTATKAGIAMTEKTDSNKQFLTELGYIADTVTVAASVPGGAPAILSKLATIALTGQGKDVINNNELLRETKDTLQDASKEMLHLGTEEILNFMKEIEVDHTKMAH